jgi:ArsR family transcriptional regulator, repressor of sdpIR and other operons
MRPEAVFKAIADPSRREILRLLKRKSMTAGDLADAFQMTKGAMSYHFNVLKAADLVRTERRGQQIIYALNMSVFEEAAVMLADLFEPKARSSPRRLRHAARQS